MSKRYFFALDIEEKDKQLIASYQDSLQLPFKKVSTNNFHITLCFLGHITEQQKLEFVEFTNALNYKVADKAQKKLLFNSLGHFNKPQVLYLALQTVPNWLTTIAFKLTNQAKAKGIFQEERAYKPHITLFRKAKYLSAADKSIEQGFLIKSFSLYQSTSHFDGVKYHPIKTWLC